LNTDNVRNWHSGGYQDWLKDQLWLDQMYAKLDFAREVLQDPERSKLREASLCIAIKQMYQLIADFDPVAFIAMLPEDPTSYARILNALAKLAEVGLKYDREHAEAHGAAVHRKKKADAKTLGLPALTRDQIEQEFNLLRRPPSSTEANGA